MNEQQFISSKKKLNSQKAGGNTKNPKNTAKKNNTKPTKGFIAQSKSTSNINNNRVIFELKHENMNNAQANSNIKKSPTQTEQNSVHFDFQISQCDSNFEQPAQPDSLPGIPVDQDGKTPVSQTIVKQKYSKMLTSYEMTEINDYPLVYYIGKSISRKISDGSFDQDQTFQYKTKIGDHIAYRYEILSVLGTGAFGTVYKCIDHKTKEKVAIKILVNTPNMNQQGQIEINNLKILSSNSLSTDIQPQGPLQLPTKYNAQTDSSESNPNLKHIIKMIDNFVFRNHICIVTELLGESLSDFMNKKPSKNQNQNQDDLQMEPLPPHMVKLIAYQIMDGLAAIHRKRIIHGDLKPQNILFSSHQSEESTRTRANSNKSDLNKIENIVDNTNEDAHPQKITRHFTFSFAAIDNFTLMSQVKIIDFGSSCKVGELVQSCIQNRFYRAPEVVLGASYGTAIDIWSAGCIIVELFTGRPLFPAENDTDLLVRFIETLGFPPKNVAEMQSDFQSKFSKNKNAKKGPAKRNKFFGDDGRLMNVTRQPVPFKTRLTSILKSSDTMMIDFLTKCLEWDKTKRLSAAKLCKHPWIAGIAKQKI